MSSKFSSDEAEGVTLNLENAEWRVVTELNAVCVTTFGYELLNFILWRKTWFSFHPSFNSQYIRRLYMFIY